MLSVPDNSASESGDTGEIATASVADIVLATTSTDSHGQGLEIIGDRAQSSPLRKVAEPLAPVVGLADPVVSSVASPDELSRVERKLQGISDWWSYLFDDDWLPHEAVRELERRLGGLARLDLDEHRLAHKSADSKGPLDMAYKGRELLGCRGVFGETLLHSCLLRVGAARGLDISSELRAMALTDFVIKTCGKGQAVDLVNSQFDTCKRDSNGKWSKEFCVRINCPNHSPLGPGPYDGETPLHMAVVFNLPSIVKLLLEHGADLTRKTRGHFFLPGGDCYYGETPLSFAVSVGALDLVKMLVTEVQKAARLEYQQREGGANETSSAGIPMRPVEIHAVFDFVTQVDSIGNTALHMCIIHKRILIFDWLLHLYDASFIPYQDVLKRDPASPDTFSEEQLVEIREAEHELWERFMLLRAPVTELKIEDFRQGIYDSYGLVAPVQHCTRFYASSSVQMHDKARNVSCLSVYIHMIYIHVYVCIHTYICICICIYMRAMTYI